MTPRRAAFARLALPAGALCACALMDPNRPPAWIFCPFRLVTGLPCPLCGMTRAIASLLRARPADALAFHLFSPLALAALLAWLLIESGHLLRLWDARPLGRLALRPAPWIASFSLCLAYGALRWWGIIGSPRM
jgi:hypothetical protein